MRKPVTKALVLAISLSGLGWLPATASANASPNVSNQFWWPELINLSPLRQHGAESNPYGSQFNYADAFSKLDLNAVKQDIRKTLTTSQPWWPADYGHYGPFFIRMAWHSAGTYRTSDGRGGAGGGQLRFEPLNSWPDNANLDKARRLLWPIKQKYGRSLSWADLMVLTGNVALESMGFKTFGFAGGRQDDWEPDLVYWGPETKFLATERRDKKGNLLNPLAAVQMGLIYVNPEGPNGVPDPLAAAKDIRESFALMAMNDEETVALIAGGHTFGKAHGAHKPEECLSAEPAASGLEEQGFGWKNKCGKGNAGDTVTSGLEGAWSVNPIAWTTQYLDNLFAFEWVQSRSPAGAIQWIPANGQAANLVPDAHDNSKRHAPIMFTTDLALKFDPAYRKIALKFRQDPAAYQLAFAKAWYKLTHRDMGPRSRYLGSEVPKEALLWEDPLPARNYALVTAEDTAALKQRILASGVSPQALVRTAWASASSFRGTDMRGGANGARIRLAPQKDWAVNNPKELSSVLAKLASVQRQFNRSAADGKQVSLADLIVLGGNAAIEQAAAQAGHSLQLPFAAGRVDATQAQTDVASFAALEPVADGFRNYYGSAATVSPIHALIDKANKLTLTVPEMTVLIGGLRALNANAEGDAQGVLTQKPGVLSNDFFVNLLSMDTKWVKSGTQPGRYDGFNRATGQRQWTASPVDLAFGSSSELRAIAEVYAAEDGREQFIQDFAKAWTKVMNLDRYDLAKQ